MIAPEPRGIGGPITSLGPEPHNHTIFYVDVDDAAAYLKKAGIHRGKTLLPPLPLLTGTFTSMQDPERNTVGLWQAKT
jgi:uncharacterized protein